MAKKYRRKVIESDFDAERFLMLFHLLEDLKSQLDALECSKKWTDAAECALVSRMSAAADGILELLIEPIPKSKTRSKL